MAACCGYFSASKKARALPFFVATTAAANLPAEASSSTCVPSATGRPRRSKTSISTGAAACPSAAATVKTGCRAHARRRHSNRKGYACFLRGIACCIAHIQAELMSAVGQGRLRGIGNGACIVKNKPFGRPAVEAGLKACTVKGCAGRCLPIDWLQCAAGLR